MEQHTKQPERLDLAQGPSWDLRLHRNGRFALRLNIKTSTDEYGNAVLTCNSATGRDVGEVWGGCLWNLLDGDLVAVRAALQSAVVYSGEAKARQRVFADKLRRAASAAKAQRAGADLDAVLAELREHAQGGAA